MRRGNGMLFQGEAHYLTQKILKENVISFEKSSEGKYEGKGMKSLTELINGG